MTRPVQTSALHEPPVVLDPQGKPARQAIDTACPRCGAGEEKRVKSGMGDPHPVCVCGYEWPGEAWRD